MSTDRKDPQDQDWRNVKVGAYIERCVLRVAYICILLEHSICQPVTFVFSSLILAKISTHDVPIDTSSRLSSRKSSDLLTGRRFIHEVSISQLHITFDWNKHKRDRPFVTVWSAYRSRVVHLEVAQEASKGREEKGGLSVEVHEAKDNKLQRINESGTLASNNLAASRENLLFSNASDHRCFVLIPCLVAIMTSRGGETIHNRIELCCNEIFSIDLALSKDINVLTTSLCLFFLHPVVFVL